MSWTDRLLLVRRKQLGAGLFEVMFGLLDNGAAVRWGWVVPVGSCERADFSFNDLASGGRGRGLEEDGFFFGWYADTRE